MFDSALGLSLVGMFVSMVWWMVSTVALNSYASSQGLNPRHAPVLFGKIWKDRQNPVRPHLIGLIVSTISLLVSFGFCMANRHYAIFP